PAILSPSGNEGRTYRGPLDFVKKFLYLGVGDHSYRSDSIGSIRAARNAGHSPLNKPIAIRMLVATEATFADSRRWISVALVGSSIISARNGRAGMMFTRIYDIKIPSRPPRNVITTASETNCSMM